MAWQVEVRNQAIPWGVLNGFEKSLADLIFSMTWRREDVESELASTIALANLTLSPINTSLSTLPRLFIDNQTGGLPLARHWHYIQHGTATG